MRMTFLGAAGTVTGSKYLLEHRDQHVLIDCGLFQGYKQLRLHNWDPFQLPVGDLGAIVLTHAHLDHSGYLPVLVRNGYRGPVYATPATCELVRILLLDSGRLQEEAAEFANRHGFSRHNPALPLYTEQDAERALKLLHPVELHHRVNIVPGMSIQFRCAGHILGAATVEVIASALVARGLCQGHVAGSRPGSGGGTRLARATQLGCIPPSMEGPDDRFSIASLGGGGAPQRHRLSRRARLARAQANQGLVRRHEVTPELSAIARRADGSERHARAL